MNGLNDTCASSKRVASVNRGLQAYVAEKHAAEKHAAAERAAEKCAAEKRAAEKCAADVAAEQRAWEQRHPDAIYDYDLYCDLYDGSYSGCPPW